MLTAAERCSLLADAVNRPGEVELPEGVTANIGGRVCFAMKGNEAGFEYLSNPTQPFPFIVGPDDLTAFCTKPTHMDMMEAIGFERNWVASKIEKGNEFRLVLFPSDGIEHGLISPTWDNILAITQRESPKAGAKLARNLDELRSTPYSDLCEKIGFNVDSIPPEIEAKVSSFDMYGDEAPDDLAHARAFLLSLIHI